MSVTKDKQDVSKLDVFMKARNLLDYTLQITSNPKVFRPDLHKDMKDLKELLHDDVKAVPIIGAMAQLIDNLGDPVENIYVWLIHKLREAANDIFIYSWQANNIRVGKSYDYKMMRFDYQNKAISACVALKAYISLAKRMCHLKSKRVTYWNKKVNVIHDELTAWRESDRERYKDIV